jgi:two-component system, chemotaxis family, sensor kinase CheA
MKIKTKLLLGLSAIPIIVLLLIVIGIIQVSSITKLSNVTQNNYQLSLLAERLQTDVKNEAISLRNIAIFTDRNQIQKELVKLEEIQDEITGKIATMETKVNTDEQIILVGKLKVTNEKFNDYIGNVTILLAQGQNEEAVNLIKTTSVPIHNEFFTIVTEITNQFETNMVTTFKGVTADFKQQIWISSLVSLISVILVTAFVFRTVLSFAFRLSKVSDVMKGIANGIGNLSEKVEVNGKDEIDEIAGSFNRMTGTLQEHMANEKDLLWIKSNSAAIISSISGKLSLESLSQTFLSRVVPLLGASQAVFYVEDKGNQKGELLYKLSAAYAASDDGLHHPAMIVRGEGILGQAVIEKSPIILQDVPSDYLKVKSGLGDAAPLTIYVIPVLFEGEVKAVLEFASFKHFQSTQLALIEEVIGSLGIILESVVGRIQLAKLLEETQVLMEEIQAQSEELQSQQEELRVTNEELEEQTMNLRHSEGILQTQAEELEQTNAELVEKAKTLEEQNVMFEQTNREVEKARIELEEKAKQLALSSKYKSEFLANMSHELRTPLNSLLILSKLLADNPSGNLSDKQVKYADTIYSSGSDLLVLINDILDLAKIEAGKMEVNPSRVIFTDLMDYAENTFRPVANEQNLDFTIKVKENLPSSFISDEQRLQQVLKNLLSNAFKFTQQGGVTLEIGMEPSGAFCFSIRDTGIGIQKEKQELIFQAFQQADGTTSRQYGGTGLGLSICREIADLLNGDIVVVSEEGKGSTFSFYVSELEKEIEPKIEKQSNPLTEAAVTIEMIEADYPFIPPSEEQKKHQTVEVKSTIKRMLIVEDDVKQRASLMELFGEKDVVIKAVSTGNDALEELKVGKFDCMILDVSNGFTLLEKIKSNPGIEDLQLFIYTERSLSGKEETFLRKYTQSIIIKDTHSQQRLKEEIDLFLNTKAEQALVQPIDPAIHDTGLEGKRILLVDDDVRNVYALMSILEQYNMDISFAENGRESLDVLEKSPDFDLILMDIMMPEMDGYETIKRIRELSHFYTLPIIALTAKAMKEDREKCLEAGASDYIVKPFDPDQLISLIRVWLYQKSKK